MAKVTPLERGTLRLIDEWSVKRQRFGYGAWRIVGASPAVVGRLTRTLGLAEWMHVTTNADEQHCVLTPAGRAALAEGGE